MLMNKLLAEFLPIVIFFILYKVSDLYIATAGLVLVSGLQVLYCKYRYGKVEKKQLITFLLLFVFGGLTVAFQNAGFLQWKVSIINWGFAIACLLSPYFSHKTLLEHLMGDQINLPPPAWKKMNTMWTVFFFAMGVINIVIAYRYSTEIWVHFKLFGMFGLTFIFMVIQSLYLMKFLKEKP